jgi:hypothetical protein
VSLEDFSSSPRVDPRLAWAWIVGTPGIFVVPLVLPELLSGALLGTMDLSISMAWCSGLGAAGLYWFYYGFSRQRGVADTPTSRIAAAAQGYAELYGEAFRLQGVRELFAQNGVPCLWYRRVGGMEPDAAADGTQGPFGVRDETGYAIVLPYHAYVEPVRRHKLHDEEGNVYVEDRILAGDKLYVLGEFTSSEPSFDLEKAVANKLLQWREDPRALLAQFDANHDGQIDAQEDGKMRVQALHAAQVEGQAAIAQYRAVNLIKSPEDGRPFIISTRPRASFSRRLGMWELLGLAAFMIGVLGVGYLGIQLFSDSFA